MPQKNSEVQIPEELKQVLDRTSGVDVATLKREGRDFSFADVHEYITEIFGAIETIRSHPDFWNYLPEAKQSNIRDYLARFLDSVDKIQNFDPTQGNPQAERDGIASQIKKVYDDLFEHLFARLRLYVLEREFSSQKIQDLLDSASQDIAEIKNQKEQGEAILKAMQEASAATGTSKFAGVFGDQARSHTIAARWWIVVTILAASGIGGFLWWIFDQLVKAIQETDANLQITLQVFLAKILLLSFFSVIFYQVVKNYNANMHLRTLNKHRENSLKSFQSFVESTSDPKIKDVVLIQATKAIFEAGETGYISSKDGGITGIETIKIVDQMDKK